MPLEPFRQDHARPRQTARHRSFGTTKLSGNLLAGPAVQIAQNNDVPMLVRQPAQFLIEHLDEIIPDLLLFSFLGQGYILPFALVSLRRCCAQSCRGPNGHAIEPVRDFFAVAQSRSFADENQKGRLKRILRIVMIAEGAPAHIPDHGREPSNQPCQGAFILGLYEPEHQLAIRPCTLCPRQDRT
jgi:hypothetical protein